MTITAVAIDVVTGVIDSPSDGGLQSIMVIVMSIDDVCDMS